MFIKPKSIVVSIVSSIVVSAVLVFTFIGYYMYIELKARDDEKTSLDLLRKVKSQIFSKYIEISKLTCAIEKSVQAGRGRPAIRGIIKNRGPIGLYDIVLRVKFLDSKGASLYEVIFHPLEPTYGTNPIGHITQSYLLGYKKGILNANSTNAFRYVIPNCPKEIADSFLALNKGQISTQPKKARGWEGSLTWEVISVGS